MIEQSKALRFKLNKPRCVEAIDLIASVWPGITQYYICKTFFFADREHLLDWGEVISGDAYYALEHGPVPTQIYNLLKPNALATDPEWAAALYSRVRIESAGNLRMTYSRMAGDRSHLVGSHFEYLEEWVRRLRPMTFGAVADLAHEDQAWKQAWASGSGSTDMDLRLWADRLDVPRETAIDALYDATLFK